MHHRRIRLNSWKTAARVYPSPILGPSWPDTECTVKNTDWGEDFLHCRWVVSIVRAEEQLEKCARDTHTIEDTHLSGSFFPFPSIGLNQVRNIRCTVSYPHG